MEKIKYLILGVNGMAGHLITEYLKEKGYAVTGFAKQKSLTCETIVGDILSKNDLECLLEKTTQYDVLINCIGILNRRVDENPSEGIFINSVFPHLLAENLSNSKTKLIHISSDCVYEGTRGNYIETDEPDATSYYGRTKALGEIIDDKNLTIRTSIVGPELKSNGIGLFHWFMNQTDVVEGYKKVIWSGVTTLQLAKAIENDLKKPQTGLYHLVNNKKISKYKLLKFFNFYCRNSPIEIRKNYSIVSDRSILNTQNEFNFFIPEYEQMVCEMAEWIKKHHELYKQYEGAMRWKS